MRAKFKVGLLYEEGEFLPQSTSTAVAWDRKAEEQGLVAAKLIDTAIESWGCPIRC
ncbi:SEL1-like repeat protein [bacterium]|nr:SEL1-like repeat protein [bacterium]